MQKKTFVKRSEMPARVEEAFAWHARPGAFERLVPPWEDVELASTTGGIGNGAKVVLRMKLGPLPVTWVAEHHDFVPDWQFCDLQTKGPFAFWDHTHRFEPVSDQASILEDHVRYALPGGSVGRWLAGRRTYRQLERMFSYRHEITRRDLRLHAKFADQPRHTVAITGSSGVVGRAFAALLTTGGHKIVRLLRRPPRDGLDFGDVVRDVVWDPATGQLPRDAFAGVDTVVHLAGENIADKRWSRKQKQKILASRVQGTRLLAETLAALEQPPTTLICASAIGFYGDRGEERLEESAAAGEGFLPDVGRQWEAATQPASEAGIRVVQARLGIVLSLRGGALKQMVPPLRMGLGGKLGSGQQWWSWISLDDAIHALYYLMMKPDLAGPVNLVSPQAVKNKTFVDTLGSALRRPTIMPVPKKALRVAVGEMADELLLASVHVVPRKLVDSGFEFEDASLKGALDHLLP